MISQVVPDLKSSFIQLLRHKLVKNADHAKSELAEIEKSGIKLINQAEKALSLEILEASMSLEEGGQH